MQANFTTEHTESTEPGEALKVKVDRLTEEIIGAAIDVHRELGPGLLESAYEACLVHELANRELSIEQQRPLPVKYKGVRLDCGYRLDIVVENLVIVEIKAVEQLIPIHNAQLLSYLKLSGLPAGLLINFNVRLLKDGLKRLVLGPVDKPSLLRRGGVTTENTEGTEKKTLKNSVSSVSSVVSKRLGK